MKYRLLIIGASGHGKVIADIAAKLNIWEEIAFLDDNMTIDSCMDFPVIGSTKDMGVYIEDSDFFIAIGNSEIRKKFQDKLELLGAFIPTLIHPSAVIGREVKIDKGTVVMAGVVINSDTNVGKGCIINTSASLDHDNCIGDYVHISPGVHLAGTVNVGDYTWLGIGSTVSNNISIVSRAVIGAGAVVVEDITETGVYIGVPARRKE